MIKIDQELTQEKAFDLYNFYFALYFLHTKKINGKEKLEELGYITEKCIEPERFIIREELVNYYNKSVQGYEQNSLFSTVIDWADRSKTGNFLKQLTLSEKFEIAVKKYFNDRYSIDIGFYLGKEQYKGESNVGIEIKNDRMSERTGNYAIECYEKMSGDNDKWVESGILKQDNTEYFFMGYESNGLLQYKIFKKATLLEIWINKEKYIKNGKIREYTEKAHGTSMGYLILNNSIQDFEENIDDVVAFIRKNYPKSIIASSK